MYLTNKLSGKSCAELMFIIKNPVVCTCVCAPDLPAPTSDSSLWLLCAIWLVNITIHLTFLHSPRPMSNYYGQWRWSSKLLSLALCRYPWPTQQCWKCCSWIMPGTQCFRNSSMIAEIYVWIRVFIRIVLCTFFLQTDTSYEASYWCSLQTYCQSGPYLDSSACPVVLWGKTESLSAHHLV